MNTPIRTNGTPNKGKQQPNNCQTPPAFPPPRKIVLAANAIHDTENAVQGTPNNMIGHAPFALRAGSGWPTQSNRSSPRNSRRTRSSSSGGNVASSKSSPCMSRPSWDVVRLADGLGARLAAPGGSL